MSAETDDRFMSAVRAIIRTELTHLKYSGVFEYVVRGVNGSIPDTTVDAEPSETSLGLPSVSRVPMRASVLGGASVPTVGNFIHLAFLNQDPARPVFVGGGAAVTLVSLDAAGTLPIARQTDSVRCAAPTNAMFTGTFNSVPTSGTITISGNFDGTITSGNAKVTA